MGFRKSDLTENGYSRYYYIKHCIVHQLNQLVYTALLVFNNYMQDNNFY